MCISACFRKTLSICLFFAVSLNISEVPQLLGADKPVEDMPLKDGQPTRREIAARAFDGYLFASNGLWLSTTRERRRQRLENMATTRIKQIDRWCNLSVAQKKKLTLASRIDVNGLFERADVARISFLQLHGNNEKPLIFTDELNFLQVQFRNGPFRKNTLVQKMLPSTLSREQLAQLRVQDGIEQQAEHHKQVVAAVSQLNAAVELDARQRTRLVQFLESKIPPSEVEGAYGIYILANQACQMSKQNLSEYLTAAQWEAWSRFAKNSGWLTQLLERENLLNSD